MNTTTKKTFSLKRFDKIENDDKRLEYFNEFHGQIRNRFYIKDFDSMPYFDIYSKQDFAICHIEIPDFLKKWYKSRNRPKHSRMIYDPTSKLKGLNTFTGYRWKYIPPIESTSVSAKKDIDVILNHMNHICGGDGINYFYHWFYRLVTQPEIKPTVALVFNGIQGCGKSVFWKFVGDYILGRGLWKSVESVKKLMGKFSGSYLQSRLIILEEANMKDSKEHTERLKNNITNIKMELQQKYENERSINNYSAHVFLTNKDIPMVIQKNDRRFCVYGCKMEVPNEEYFNRLEKAFQNDEAIIGLIMCIGNRVDMKKFHIAKDRYFSEEYEMIKHSTSRNSVDMFFDNLPKTDHKSSEILDKLRKFFEEKGWNPSAWNQKRLGLYMRKKFGIERRRRTTDGMVWNLQDFTGCMIDGT